MAVSVTEVPLANDWLQVPEAQLIPEGFETTSPLPPTVTCSDSIWTEAAKLAETLSIVFTEMEQDGLEPEHAPLHPTKTCPAAGEAVSVNGVPTGNGWVQEDGPEQSMPAGLEVTAPEPPIVTTTVSSWIVGGGVGLVPPGPPDWGVAVDPEESPPPISGKIPPPQPANTPARPQTTAKRPNTITIFVLQLHNYVRH